MYQWRAGAFRLVIGVAWAGVEQVFLRVREVAIDETGKAHAGQPEAGGCGQVEAVTQSSGGVGKRLFRRRRAGGGEAAREHPEVARLQLEHYRARDAVGVLRAFAQVAGPGLARQPADVRLQLGQRQIMLEGVLRGDLQGGPFELYRALVDAA